MKNTNTINTARAELQAIGAIGKNDEINTKNAWRKLGYKVNKDESPIVTLPIYIYAPYNTHTYDKNGNPIMENKMLNVRANFYAQHQVTEL